MSSSNSPTAGTAAAQTYTMTSRWEHADDRPSDGGRYVARRFTVTPRDAVWFAPETRQGRSQRVVALATDNDSTEEEEVIEANIGHARDPSQSLPSLSLHSRAVSNKIKDSHSHRDDRNDRNGRNDRDDMIDKHRNEDIEDGRRDRDQPSRRYMHVAAYNQPLLGRDTLVNGQLAPRHKKRPQYRQETSPRPEPSSISYPSPGPRRSYSRDGHGQQAHGPHYRGHKHRSERRHSDHDAVAWDEPGDSRDSSSILGLSSWLRRIGIFDDNHGAVGKHGSRTNTTGSSGSSHVKRHSRQHDTSPRQSRWEDDNHDVDADGVEWDLPPRRRYYGSGNSSPYHPRTSSPYADKYPDEAMRRYDGNADDDDDGDGGWDDDHYRSNRHSARTRSVRNRRRSVGCRKPGQEDREHRDHKQRQERKSTISAAAKNALKAGAMAVLNNASVPGDWLGEKGSRVATAALGAALVDTFMSQNYPKSVNGIRHTAMRQMAERTIKNMVTEPIFQRAAQHRGSRGYDRPAYKASVVGCD